MLLSVVLNINRCMHIGFGWNEFELLDSVYACHRFARPLQSIYEDARVTQLSEETLSQE